MVVLWSDSPIGPDSYSLDRREKEGRGEDVRKEDIRREKNQNRSKTGQNKRGEKTQPFFFNHVGGCNSTGEF